MKEGTSEEREGEAMIFFAWRLGRWFPLFDAVRNELADEVACMYATGRGSGRIFAMMSCCDEREVLKPIYSLSKSQ